MSAQRLESTVLKLPGTTRVVPTIHPWRTIALHPVVYLLLGLGVLFGTIEGSKAIGFWTTSGRVTGTGEAVVLSGNDPLEIKGWMTLDQIATAYRVPLDGLKEGAGIPAAVPGSTELKQIEKLAPGFSPQAVRDWLQARQPR